jgi:predicted SAM-dependent methyltransferase
MKIIRKIKFFHNLFSPKISFVDLSARQSIFLYAGDVPKNEKYCRYIGLSLSQSNSNHIKHDVTKPLPLADDCVDIYQSEDVFEHIETAILPDIINEIFRVLKPGGTLRLSLPDYRCDILYERSLTDANGKLIYDPGGGGKYVDGKVINGGHVWFPIYEDMKSILDKTLFKQVFFYHYYDESGNPITKDIDYSFGHIMRTPDHDDRVKNPYRPMSIVVDCRK